MQDQKSLEYVAVKLLSNIHLIAVYKKPTNEFTTKEIDAFLKVGGKVILYGNVNARHKTWNCPVKNKRG